MGSGRPLRAVAVRSAFAALDPALTRMDRGEQDDGQEKQAAMGMAKAGSNRRPSALWEGCRIDSHNVGILEYENASA